MHPNVCIEDLIAVSETFAAAEKSVDKKPVLARIDDKKQVGFGRTMKVDRVSSTGKLKLIRNGKIVSPGKLVNEPQRPNSMQFMSCPEPDDFEVEQELKEQRRKFSLNRTSRRMLLSAEQKMKTLQDYKNGVFKKQVEELQLKQMPYRYKDVFIRHATTPLFTATPLEKSDFDNTNFILEDVSPERPQRTYITQMGQVDMDMKKSATLLNSRAPNSEFNFPRFTQTENKKQKKPRKEIMLNRMVPKERK